jgi:hypothetical protein
MELDKYIKNPKKESISFLDSDGKPWKIFKTIDGIKERQTRTLHEILHRKKRILKFKSEICFKTLYIKKNRILRNYFKTNFKFYTINTKNITCNFSLMTYLFKDYNKVFFKDITIEKIKQMLINVYKYLYAEHEISIRVKWNKEKLSNKMSLESKKVIQNYNKSLITYEEAILMESYVFTNIDMILIMYYYKLPITLIYQKKSKKEDLTDNLKLLKFKNNKNEKFQYYIKVTSNSKFSLLTFKEEFKIYSTEVNGFDKLPNKISISEYFTDNSF